MERTTGEPGGWDATTGERTVAAPAAAPDTSAAPPPWNPPSEATAPWDEPTDASTDEPVPAWPAAVDPVGEDPTGTGDPGAAGPPLPPADVGEPGPDELRRRQIDALVQRCLDPAAGLCLRVLDPDGFDPVGREQAAEIARDALARAACRRLASDDEAVVDVFRRTAVAGMDALAGSPGSGRLPASVSLQDLLGDQVDAAEVAPGGHLRFAVLVDAVSSSRATDRQVAFMVMAAGLQPSDTAQLLGHDIPTIHAALERLGKRLADGHHPGDLATAEHDGAGSGPEAA